MRKVIAALAIFGFVAALGAGSALAQDFVSGCVKEKGDGSPKKNSKLKRVAIGTSPGSSCGSKEVGVTLVTDQLSDSLQSQIDANSSAIAANDNDISDNSDRITVNEDMITNIKAGLISSMIGGGHNYSSVGDETFFMPLFEHLRNADESKVTSKVAVTGWLTRLVVIQDEATGDADIGYRYMVNGVPIDLSPFVADDFCVTSGDSGDASTMCQSEGCFKINVNDTLSVRVAAVAAGNPPNISPARWTGRFVETTEECPEL